MVEESIKATTQNAAPAKSKAWKYVGPGTTGHKDKKMPLISNLPLDLKNPRLGTRQGSVPADELAEELIQYVLDTNTHAAGWWVFE